MTTIRNSADLGRAVRAARKAQKLATNDAAALCGVSIQFLQDLEHGKPTIQFDRALHVAAQLGLVLVLGRRGLEALNEDRDAPPA